MKLLLQSQRTEILKISTFRILHPDFAESLVLFEKTVLSEELNTLENTKTCNFQFQKCSTNHVHKSDIFCPMVMPSQNYGLETPQ